MRNHRFALLLIAAGLCSEASAQLVDSISLGYRPRTGDVTVDAQLGDINVFARGNMDGFVDDVVVSYGAPRYYVRELVYDRGWAPADVHYACALAQLVRMHCEEVVRIYDRDRGQGWGVIAQRLGIKPGSAEFHALKGKLGQSHGKLKAKGRGQGAVPTAGKSTGKPDHAGQGKGQGKGKDKGRGG